MMQLTIDNHVRLSGESLKLRRELMDHFVVENPAYLAAVKTGRCTYGLERMLSFCQEDAGALILPRGAARVVLSMAREYGKVEIIDNRIELPEIGLQFKGTLRPYQQQAALGAMAKDLSVLEAGTGAGKTVMGLAVIAARQQPALVLVHTKELLYQWRDRVQQFLGIKTGLIGDGNLDIQPVTVGIVNTVKKHLPAIAERFGHVVVDECHRVPSTLFSETVTAFPAKYTLGLSATPYRRDGLDQLIGWFIGLHHIRVETATLHQIGAILRPKIITRETGFRYSYADDYSKMLSALAEDQARNSLIAADIRGQTGNGGLTLVVSDRVAHLETLAAMAGVDHALLTGRTTTKRRREIVGQLAGGDVPVLFSTLSLIGEGFDCPAMDSLFIASPIKYRGRLVQTVGRVLRPAEGKEPVVYDYHDTHVGVLSYQWKMRQKVFDEMIGIT